MFKEFKAFIARGNMMDLAIGVIMGSAFGKIVSSFVADVIMPPIGILLGGVDFSNLAITLKKATETSEAVTLNYGLFINTVIDFLIISLVIFIIVRQLNKLKKKEEKKEEKPMEPAEEIVLLREIRDQLKKK
ncbi:MAG TPA: large-conductance mechanosensitive channel protein MscL [Candidatus Dojkabacteria bacterium]|nr:large-conductance mechanosensitive channel protein MscL [Candidatus Dojkabacteria bacterium]HQF36512.1 large-conductance mechanosensitive channel protein MscL [Candidatus Dojkabacteria bacterium]